MVDGSELLTITPVAEEQPNLNNPWDSDRMTSDGKYFELYLTTIFTKYF